MPEKDSDWHIPPEAAAVWTVAFLPLIIAASTCLLLPIVVRLKTASIVTLFCTALGSGIVGIVSLLIARLPLYRQRRFWTFGPGALDQRHRRFYWLGYALFVVSVLLFGIVWLRARGA
jgi:hypothetical protein